jgi:hypothetical protein
MSTTTRMMMMAVSCFSFGLELRPLQCCSCKCGLWEEVVLVVVVVILLLNASLVLLLVVVGM